MKNNQFEVSSLLAVTAIALSTLGLSGCSGDRVKLANEQMDTIKAEPAGQVEPIPEPEIVRDYKYDSEDMRSPFLPPSLLTQLEKIESVEGIRPDVTRIQEPLEDFELSQLTYRGLVIPPSGEQYGLIQRPDGLIESVKVGDYMGKNNGRVIEITSTQINLIEIVADSRVGGYVERAASVVSP